MHIPPEQKRETREQLVVLHPEGFTKVVDGVGKGGVGGLKRRVSVGMRSLVAFGILSLTGWIVREGGFEQHARAEERGEGAVSFDFFYDTLSPHGDWLEVPGYGACWRPEVSNGWAPYTEGGWSFTDVGWTWVSREPFGGIVFHYGRWLLTNAGWVWVPGYEWGPAWVSWRQSSDHLGWAPLPPEIPWYPNRGISSWVDVHADTGPEYYRFCPVSRFGAPMIREFLEPVGRNWAIIQQTQNITNITVYRGSVFCGGPRYNWIRERSEYDVRTLRVVREQNLSRYRSGWEGGEVVSSGYLYNDVLVLPAPQRISPPTSHYFSNPLPLWAGSLSRGWDRDEVHRGHEVREHMNREWESARQSGRTSVAVVSTEERRGVPSSVNASELRRLSDSGAPKVPLVSLPASASSSRREQQIAPISPESPAVGGPRGGDAPARGAGGGYFSNGLSAESNGSKARESRPVGGVEEAGKKEVPVQSTGSGRVPKAQGSLGIVETGSVTTIPVSKAGASDSGAVLKGVPGDAGLPRGAERLPSRSFGAQTGSGIPKGASVSETPSSPASVPNEGQTQGRNGSSRSAGAVTSESAAPQIEGTSRKPSSLPPNSSNSTTKRPADFNPRRPSAPDVSPVGGDRSGIVPSQGNQGTLPASGAVGGGASRRSSLGNGVMNTMPSNVPQTVVPTRAPSVPVALPPSASVPQRSSVPFPAPSAPPSIPSAPRSAPSVAAPPSPTPSAPSSNSSSSKSSGSPTDPKTKKEQ